MVRSRASRVPMLCKREDLVCINCGRIDGQSRVRTKVGNILRRVGVAVVVVNVSVGHAWAGLTSSARASAWTALYSCLGSSRSAWGRGRGELVQKVVEVA